MPPESRALLAALVLAIFGWTLTPRAVPVKAGDDDVEKLLTLSRDAFDKRNWDAALQPTTMLVEKFPNQQVFAERLAKIYAGLDKADHRAAWRRNGNLAKATRAPTPDRAEENGDDDNRNSTGPRRAARARIGERGRRRHGDDSESREAIDAPD